MGGLNTLSDVASATDELTSITLGSWTITENSDGHLEFTDGGSVRIRMDNDGVLRASDDIGAFETL